MKVNLKTKIFYFLLGAIIFSGIIVIADIKMNAEEIGYKTGNVKDALDSLYKKADAISSSSLKLCELKTGNAMTVGSKYECTLGDKDENDEYVKRNFYVLTVNSNNTIDLIMERNITEGTNQKKVQRSTAINFFSSGNGIKYKNAWTNVIDIDLPSAVTIAKVVNNNQWTLSNDWFCLGLKDQSSCVAGDWSYANEAGKTAVEPYKWIFNYTNSCYDFGCDLEASLNNSESYGYWTKDLNPSNSNEGWIIDRKGYLYKSSITGSYYGVRPVITVLKTSLY